MRWEYPSILRVETILRSAHQVSAQISGGRWVPARPSGYPSFWSRLRAAWLVFRGRADAVTWPEQ